MRPSGSSRRFREYIDGVRERQRASKDEKVHLTWHGTERSAKRTRSFGTLFRAFLQLLRPFRGAMLLALGTLTISTTLVLVPPAVTKFAIDFVFPGKPFPEWLATLPVVDMLPDGPRGQLALLVAIVLVCAFIGTPVAIIGRWKATQTVKRLQASLRTRAFGHAARLPLTRVTDLKSGGATSLIREDAGGVGELVFAMIYNPWRAIVQLGGSLAILAITDWRLLVGALLLLPAIWYTHRTWIGRIRPLYRDIRQQRQDVDSHATESFGGMRVVRGFNRTRSEESRFARGNHLMIRQEMNVWWWARGVELVWALAMPLASAALLWFGGMMVVNGTLTTGELIMFLAYLAMLFGPLEVLATSATAFQTNLAGLDRVLDLLEEDRELPDRPDAKHVTPATVEGRVELRDVHFTYPGQDTEVLRGIDIVAEPGQMVALVGMSGAGKTTLCNLVARFFDPTGGALLLDGTDVRDIRLEDYRGLLGIVEQDVFLFDGTVAENIAYARRDATPEQLRAASEAAAALEFIDELPDGFDTRIGERGVRLSGGQRQRLAIARAILADPRILILDEATSNLDTQSERHIQRALQYLMRGRTSFVIAHRLSTIMHADRIVVLRHGRVLESGTHDELMASSGEYQRMVIMQTTRDEEPATAE